MDDQVKNGGEGMIAGSPSAHCVTSCHLALCSSNHRQSFYCDGLHKLCDRLPKKWNQYQFRPDIILSEITASFAVISVVCIYSAIALSQVFYRN